MQITAEMQPEIGLSVTEAARRAQILTATIDVLAEHGYSATTFESIRARAGLSSTRMISYHFGTKADLMNAVLGILLHAKEQFVLERAGQATGRTALLRAHLRAETDFVRAHPDAVRALDEVRRNAGQDPIMDALQAEMRYGRLERQLRQGQQEGEFGEFAPAVMARTIAHSVDGAAAALAADPATDLEAYGDELADLFERATRPAGAATPDQAH
ncbi:helix-turn-helix domain containing protein [Amycolatopsis cynarae]|uniref:Helix-turn-helix domain containing protein n=1 Tax=Amycolatopsis cynarae TaxID=2995223 RepID=A0ABY7AW00_9PSEU|nr:TetR/AcrR family transcriptional regulator [Amycolatopsis sp. HUAS 11-8]WAL63369.1 helix-turn-helix domain containing protein [Amycolatopsis sp. HUAS 11-8]